MDHKINKEEALYAPKRVLLIEPTHFAQNKEASVDNTYMATEQAPADIQAIVLAEHKGFQNAISSNGGEAVVYKQFREEAADSIFACDWLLTLRGPAFPEGLLVVFPMRWGSRRIEKNPTLISDLRKTYADFIDLTAWEAQDKALESVGVISFDYHNRVLYMNASERASPEVLQDFVSQLNQKKKDDKEFRACLLDAWDPVDKAVVFHTSMYLNFTDSTVFYGPEFITCEKKRKELTESFEKSGYDIIYLTIDECRSFCSNVLEFKDEAGKLFLVVSTLAKSKYSKENLEKLEKKYTVLEVSYDQVMKYGGGSIRCSSNPLF